MDKQEFLTTLRGHLTGEIPDYEIESNIRYYNDYISQNDGKSENDKLIELGDPRLIAKTIIDAFIASKEASGYAGYNTSHIYDDEVYDRESNEDKSYNPNYDDLGKHIKFYTWDNLKWYQKLAVIGVGGLIIVALFSLIALGINLLFTVVLPVVVIVIIIKIIMNLFKK